MVKKARIGIMLALLFTSMLSLAFNVQPAKSESGTIYIRADGSIYPSTAPIQREGDIYTFTSNIDDSIVVQRDNILIDGAGHKLQGTGAASSKGVDIPGRSNVVVRNLEISAFDYGIYLNLSQNCRIIGNNITNGPLNSRGIRISGSNNAILRNNISENSVGIQGSNSNVFGNNITSNTWGLILSGCNIAENNIVRNTYGVYQSGENTFVHNNFIDNQYQYTELYVSNVWDDGYPSGGNYWSNFEERYPDIGDIYSGPYQNETGSDGVWDHSYYIGWVDGSNRDNYPFVNPCEPSAYHELVVFTSTTPDWTPLGDLFSINATVTNQGSTDESNVELLLLINGTAAESVTIPLLKVDGSYTLSYPWIPALKGKYNITAYALPVSGERWLENNREIRSMFVWARLRIGVKAGDWIKYDYAATNAPSGTTIPEWMKVEILAVEGTNITLRLTMHQSNETENSETLTLNFSGYYNYYPRGTLDTLFGCCFIIAANRAVGELSINTVVVPTNYGVSLSMNLNEETTRTCAGVSRTLVFSQWPGYLGGRYGSQPLKYYWDKQTGILVEASVTIDGVPVTAKATDTNMWEAVSEEGSEEEVPFWMQWWFYAMVAAGVVAVVGAVYFLKKRKPPTPAVPSLTVPTATTAIHKQRLSKHRFTKII